MGNVTYSSDERVYGLGDLEGIELYNFTEDLMNRFEEASGRAKKECEGVCSRIRNDIGYDLKTNFSLFWALRGVSSRGVIIETERLYISQDERELRSAGMFDLATVKKEGSVLVLRIWEHHTIGIDPNFIYEVGGKHGKRIS